MESLALIAVYAIPVVQAVVTHIVIDKWQRRKNAKRMQRELREGLRNKTTTTSMDIGRRDGVGLAHVMTAQECIPCLEENQMRWVKAQRKHRTMWTDLEPKPRITRLCQKCRMGLVEKD